MATAAAVPLRVLHIGLGAFHRAHQAVYLQRLHDAGDTRWSLASGNIRPERSDAQTALEKNGGRYTLETVTPAGERSYQRIESIRTIVPCDEKRSAFVSIGSEAATRIISFTVTEAGYSLDDTSGIYAVLSAVLRERMRRGTGAVTLLCCDNLRHNGDRTRAGLLQFMENLGDAPLLQWTRENTTSPNAMVDRITPRPTPDVAERVKAQLGIDDPAAVMGESFIQWVIEDDFINGRPAWDKVGVQMVPSVAPYEEAKIRLLNATHSCIAWGGTLAGHEYIHEAARDDEVRRFAHDYATGGAIPVLLPSPIDLPAYLDLVLERFSNSIICDTIQRVATDSFAKIPAFILPTFRDRLAQGQGINAVAMLPALFLACLERWHRGTLPYAYQDQAMDPTVAHAICESVDPVAALAADRALWSELAGNETLIAALRRASERVKTFAAARSETG